MTRKANTKPLLRRANTFSLAQLTVVSGERLDDQDVICILQQEFGEDHLVWRQLVRNPQLRRSPSIHRLIEERYLELRLRRFARALPRPRGRLERWLRKFRRRRL